LPPLDGMSDVRGVLTWFLSDSMPDPAGFLRWAEAVVDSGRKFVILGDLAAGRDYRGRRTPLSSINRFLARLGLRAEGEWVRITYDARLVHRNPSMVEFERPLHGVLPPFEVFRTTNPEAVSYLRVRRGSSPEGDSDLVVISPTGGLAAQGYILYQNEDFQKRQLYLNPFEFFRLAFGTDDLPTPDFTTLCGRRIYYSHVDGDGWHNLSDIEAYRARGALSSEVILERIIRPYPDLPVTVAPIAADLDPAWYGSERALRVAKTLFALPHVEAGSHTYSHPLFWNFFVDGTFEEEKRLARQADRNGNTAMVAEHMHGHQVPRSYLLEPFSLDQEVSGSVAFINSLLPPGKRVELYQWSGDTHPFAAAMEATRAAGLKNINGGDSRLDDEYPSYAWVAPLGRKVGGHWQIYASNSNENTYTDLFTGRYFGFRDLVRTLENTEHPRRIKPINIYYHMYSGEKLASLKALLGNLEYARAREIAPITAAHYAAIADGFYTTRIARLGSLCWRVEDRGELQTLRFDGADRLGVDFGRSAGVLGQRHYQGSLYVSLDPAVASPIVQLVGRGPGDAAPVTRPYLVQSRWHLWELSITPEAMSFSARGFGNGDMTWKMRMGGRYKVEVSRGGRVLAGSEVMADGSRMLQLSLEPLAVLPVRVTLVRLEDPS
ncbi:MAG: hypothetical protein ABIG68_03730, partial [Acidobacteriota bacterium]